MAGKNDYVVLLAMAVAGFFLPKAFMEENKRAPDKGYRFHLSHVFLLILGSPTRPRNSIRAPAKSRRCRLFP